MAQVNKYRILMVIPGESPPYTHSVDIWANTSEEAQLRASLEGHLSGKLVFAIHTIQGDDVGEYLQGASP
jgi:hypothetical protein